MATKVLGIKELQQALSHIPAKMQQNVLRSGNRALANEFVKSIKNNPNLPATVRKAIRLEADPAKRLTKGYIVGLRKPFSRLGHLIEFGTAERTQRTTGRATGRMPATPWLRPVLDELGGDRASQIWAKAASRNFELQMRKLARK
ncbi:hypothetical protein [Microcystis phage Mae-JY04]|uniref:hypothetical protein n=1 Tax=Blastomonas sp. TaxID=1909299 RepID=UPI00258DA8E2|nr:hypothetical protein [Blastomonas sp.]